jgi:hypothetical protein
VADLLAEARTRVDRADPADVPAALTVAWQAFGLVHAVGQLLAGHDMTQGVPYRDGLEFTALAGAALRRAPSLPASIEPVELHVAGSPTSLLESADARQLVDAVLDLALALNILLPAVAEHAAGDDEHACRATTAIAYELGMAYGGYMRDKGYERHPNIS